MKKHPFASRLLIIALFLVNAGILSAAAVKTYDVFEVEMTARNEYDNPYLAAFADDGTALVTVTFTGTGGNAQGMKFAVDGFWDGGKTWRARFAPTTDGTWSYTSASKDPGLNGVSGSLSSEGWSEAEKEAIPTRRGFIRVCKTGDRPNRYFEYADGTPFLWIADTWWNWTFRGIYMSTFQALVNDRAEKGFTIGQLFVPGNGWSQRSSILDSTYTMPDIEHMRFVDGMIRYANSKGMTMWVHAWWSREDIDDKIGAEKMRRWWRYLVHRLGAYNVIWVLAGEYNMNNYGGFSVDFWKNLGQMVKDEDPYERIVSAHPTPPNWRGGRDAPQWSTSDALHNEPWLDYNQSQIGHEQYRNELVPEITARDYAKQPAKPHVQSECWYENLYGCTGEDVRFAAWGNMLSGGAGHTYGSRAGMTATVKETYRPREGRDEREVDFMLNTLDLPGAAGVGHMAKFLKSIDWWKLAPHPELMHEYAGRYCAAVPGSEYVAYLRYGGNVLIDLSPSTSSDTFEYRWYDPRTGAIARDSTTAGGELHRFNAPGTEDWVLHVKKQQ